MPCLGLGFENLDIPKSGLLSLVRALNCQVLEHSRVRVHYFNLLAQLRFVLILLEGSFHHPLYWLSGANS